MSDRDDDSGSEAETVPKKAKHNDSLSSSSSAKHHGKKPVKKARKIKDKSAPKRAKTAFIIFSSEMRPDVKRKTPDMTFSDIGKRLAELWRAVSPEDKKKYEAAAAEDKARYDREKKNYESTKRKEEEVAKEKEREKKERKRKRKEKRKRKHSDSESGSDSDSESGSDSESSASESD